MYSYNGMFTYKMKRDSIRKNSVIRFSLLLLCIYIARNSDFTSRSPYVTLTIFIGIVVLALFGTIMGGIKPGKARLVWLLTLIPLLYSSPSTFDAILFASGVVFLVLFGAHTNDIKGILNTIIFIGVVNAFFVFYQVAFPAQIDQFARSYYTSSQYTYFKRIAESGYYSGINALVGDTASYLCNAMGVFFCYLINPRKEKIRIMSWVLFVFLVIALLYTGKRSHLIIVILTFLLMYVILSRGSERVRRVIVFIIIGIGSYIIIANTYHLFFQVSTITRIIDSFNSYLLGGDISSGRWGLYDYAIREFTKSPILGIGWKSFVTNSQTVYGYTSAHYVNNDYLQILCEMGIIGFLLTFMPMFFHYIKCYKYMKNLFVEKARGSSEDISLFTYSVFIQTFFLAYAFFENPYYNRCFLFMYFLAVVVSYNVMESRQRAGI